MNRNKLKSASDSEVIVDYIQTYGDFCANMNLGRGVQRLGEHWKDLDKEVLKRGILTPEQIERLHM